MRGEVRGDIRLALDCRTLGMTIHLQLHALHGTGEFQRRIIPVLGSRAHRLVQHALNGGGNVRTVECRQRLCQDDGLQPFHPFLPAEIAQLVDKRVFIRGLPSHHSEQCGT